MKKYLKFPAIIIFFAIFACGSAEAPTNKIKGSSVTLLTHDSFAVSEGLFDTFTSETGIRVEQLSLGDTGQLISSSILTKKSPLGDVIFGIDNTFLSRALMLTFSLLTHLHLSRRLLMDLPMRNLTI